MSFDEVCGVCGGRTFWTSRRGYLVCWRCSAGDAWLALEILGRRIPGGVKLVQSWRLQDPNSTPLMASIGDGHVTEAEILREIL
jgi:hypothetical protein